LTGGADIKGLRVKNRQSTAWGINSVLECNEVRDERDPEGGDDAVDHVAQCSAHRDHQPVPDTVFQRTPDADDANRPDRCRERKPNDRTLQKIRRIHVDWLA
jgi:hypothetical protein